MNWDEWVEYLEKLVRAPNDSQKVYLLTPRHGTDLDEHNAKDLAAAIHQRLFECDCPENNLVKLIHLPARFSLPVLYFSAWLARQQDNRIAFWPYFNDWIIKNKISSQKVYSTIAPLLSQLWWHMHDEWRIYRPLEGRVNVKWPQVHAGLTEHEVDFLTRIIAKETGWSDIPPDILNEDPEEFLYQLKIWLKFENQLPRQLEILLFGPEGIALVFAELIQNLVRRHWPPIKTIDAFMPRLRTPAPYVVIRLYPLEFSIVLPEGDIIGEFLITACCGDDKVHLETGYFPSTNSSRYKEYKWLVQKLPWEHEIKLNYGGYEELHLTILPECPFTSKNPTFLMFDACTGRYVRKWRPNVQYLLLINRGEMPTWVDKLFVDIEIVDTNKILTQEIIVLTAVGRDITSYFGRIEASNLFRELEEAGFGRSLLLPDLDDLYAPSILFRGGALISEAPEPAYYVDEVPNLLVQNIQEPGLDISLHMRQDNGIETNIGSISLHSESSIGDIALELLELNEGFYVIRGLKQPLFFSLVPERFKDPVPYMSASLTLLYSDDIASSDDIRHFEEAGIEIKAWPYANGLLYIKTESGTKSCPFRIDEAGIKNIRSVEIDVPLTTRWISLKAKCWLAESEVINLTYRPFVQDDKWTLNERTFKAIIRGVEPGITCQLSVIPPRPWEIPIDTISSVVNSDYSVRFNLRSIANEGWILLMDGSNESIWLRAALGSKTTQYAVEDLYHIYTNNYSPPPYLFNIIPIDTGFSEMNCLFRLADIARKASIPANEDPVPENLIKLVETQYFENVISIKLPWQWGNHHASIEMASSPPCGGKLCVCDKKFEVRVLPLSTSCFIWDEASKPCICVDCNEVMTHMEQYTHKCNHKTWSVRLLPSKVPYINVVNWNRIMKYVEQLLLQACEQGYSEGPEGFQVLWLALQESYRSLSQPSSISPVDWIKGSIAGWLSLLELLNFGKGKSDRLRATDSVLKYGKGIVAMSKVYK